MPDITVFPHGSRWAVADPGAESASEEFETREAAEMAARQLAAGGNVRVLDSDPTGLEHEATEASDDDAAGREPPQPADIPESVRSNQPGL